MIPDFTTLSDFFRYLKIAAPTNPDFGIFHVDEQYDELADAAELSYRHHFYTIGIYEEMQVDLSSGMWKITPQGPFIYFSTPRQLISRKIKTGKAKGWEIAFTGKFIQQHKILNSIITDFSFLQIDKAKPFEINEDSLGDLTAVFEKILREYESVLPDRFEIIANYVTTLLLLIRRLYQQQPSGDTALFVGNDNEQLLAQRFLSLLEHENNEMEDCDDCSVTYFANQLSMHPNYLNAVVKKVTGSTPLQLIQERVINLSKTLLLQTPMSIKEISFELSFSEPTHFGAFFKKHTGFTPAQFRKESHL